MAQGEKALPSADNTIEHFPLASPPSTPASTRYLFQGLRNEVVEECIVSSGFHEFEDLDEYPENCVGVKLTEQ
jgi:hypothetical protein